jgi:hypothetical protein
LSANPLNQFVKKLIYVHSAILPTIAFT